jgi:hypothetical protein
MLTLAFLFALLTGLSPQGVPTLADQTGTITGVLKDAAGKPVAGVRVGAIAVPESPADVGSASAMVSLAATDESGRYRLESIPPGRYYVAAGRVDFPTYYPGTQALARGTIIAIAPKAVVEGLDFAMVDSSARVADPVPSGNIGLRFALPLQVKVEGGGKLPVFSPNGFLVLRLTNTSNGVRTEIPINASMIPVPNATVEFQINVENLPAGYAVKSIMTGTTEIRNAMLRVAALTFAAATGPGVPMIASSVLVVTLTPPSPRAAQAAASGVRVAGRSGDMSRRSIYLSGKPGMFYSDGTFEFRGVPPGQHVLATLENPESRHPRGASVSVANSDVEGVDLSEVFLLPQDIQAGRTSHLAAFRLNIVDEESGEPAGPGTVYFLNPNGTSLDLPSDGKLEFPRLLPGKYSFEIQVFRHATVARTIVLGDEDIDLRIATAAVN